MKRYEVYIYDETTAKLRFETNDLDEACDKGQELETKSKEIFEGTIIRDTKENKWFGQHKRGTAYVLAC